MSKVDAETRGLAAAGSDEERPTCLYCGKVISRSHDVVWKEGKPETLPSYRYGTQREHYPTAWFCSLRCGYRFAMAWAKYHKGRRPQQGQDAEEKE